MLRVSSRQLNSPPGALAQLPVTDVQVQRVLSRSPLQFGAPNFAGIGSPNDGYSEEALFHTIDAQLSYAFKNGPLQGLTLYLEGRNLNNAALTTYNNGDPRQLTNWQKYGASFRTGVSYKY